MLQYKESVKAMIVLWANSLPVFLLPSTTRSHVAVRRLPSDLSRVLGIIHHREEEEQETQVASSTRPQRSPPAGKSHADAS